MQGFAANKMNMTQLRVFEAVYRLKNMTLAAHELHLTQSGVSQHIQTLEKELGKRLFVRTKTEVFAVPEAQELYLTCVRSFADLGQALSVLSEQKLRPFRGLVKIGVPTDFGHNLVIPLLALWSKRHPEVQFDLIYGYSSEMTHHLEQGLVDFAFIDSVKKTRAIEVTRVYQENLGLVASVEYLKAKEFSNKTGRDFWRKLMSLDYLEYQHDEPLVHLWFRHHYGTRKYQLQIRAWAMSVQGIASFVSQGMGAAVLPDHVIQKLQAQGQSLQFIKGPGGILINEISLAWPRKRPLSFVAEELRQFLLLELSKS